MRWTSVDFAPALLLMIELVGVEEVDYDRNRIETGFVIGFRGWHSHEIGIEDSRC